MGAAYMSLAISFTNFSVMMFFVSTRLFVLRLLKIMRRPISISILMSIVFLVLNQIGQNIIVTISIATLSYVFFAGLLISRKPGEAYF